MTAQPDTATKSPALRRIAVIVVGGLAGLAVGLAAVYGIAALTRNAGDKACAPALATARRLGPLAHGDVAALAVASKGLRVPDLTFRDAAGAQHKLSQWRGRTVLLNLWATWCVPCRKEMPALDALQAKLGSPQFQVVSINIDTRDPEKPHAWLKQIGVTRLTYYADPSGRVFQDLKAIGKAFGMPTTMLVDPAGCELGTMAGPAEWAGEDAVKLIKAAVAG
jgi:thiol-disulfide isomerase/thioredoxin